MKMPKFMKKLSAKKPEIMFVAGVGLIVVGTVTACVAAFKEREDIEKMQDDLDDIKERQENGEITEEEAKPEITHVYIRTGVATVKHFALPLIFEGLGLAMITKSHLDMKAGLGALGLELTKKTQEFREYRKNVIADGGKEADDKYRGIVKDEVEVESVGEDNVVVVDHVNVKKLDKLNKYSEFAKFFDESSRFFSDDPEENLRFLNKQMMRMTDRLRTDGFLFLNEVYEVLGIPKTVAGQRIGWICGKGDDFVDFGLREVYVDGKYDEQKANFINGLEPRLLLDFNVYGDITDEFISCRRGMR